MTGEGTTGHVFISYVHEDASEVKRLTAGLEEGGAEVWLDHDRLAPGDFWKETVRQAIESGTFFIACFSDRYLARGSAYMNEELTIAIDELRKRPRDRAWFLPVLLDPDTLPTWSIGAGLTLHDLQYVALYEGWDDGVRRLLDVIKPGGPRQVASSSHGPPTRLKRPVSATYFNRSELFESSGSEPFANTVDAALEVIAHSVGEIGRRLESRAPLSARDLYSTPSGAANWMALCRHAGNRHYMEALSFWHGTGGKQVAELVRDQFGRDDFDYVSLGCGDGQKDAELVRHWLDSQADIVYYPYDISVSLLSEAIRLVLDRVSLSSKDRLYIKGVIADINQLDTMHGLFRQRSSPNVVALLGNGLGILKHEHEVLRTLRDGLSDQDLLVLEVRLISGDPLPDEHARSAWEHFYFSPLADLGVPFEPSKMTFQTAQGVSSIRGTNTCVVKYEGIQFGGARYEDITLAQIHSYKTDDFLNALRDNGFEILYTTNGRPSGSLVCVARRTT